jgi:KDO2-lipid IV(A) lauroyltransferase
MAADQSPSNVKDCYWIDFLNQETACLHGPEKYARLHELPVYYIDIQWQKRGYYKLYLSLLTDKPLELEPGKLTELYMKTLESRIKEKPEYWLWSHRRWKHKK